MVFSVLMVFTGEDCPKHKVLMHFLFPLHLPVFLKLFFFPFISPSTSRKMYLEIQEEKRHLSAELFDPVIFYII